MPSISAALYDLLNEQASPVEDALERHFRPEFRQSTNGDWIDRATFVEQMTVLRSFVDHVEIEVLAELTQGDSYAERHVLTATQRDGGTASQEVFLFGVIAEDGRFASLEELVRPLS